MSLPWVKLHVPLLDNEDYKRFSPQAQHLYMTLLMLAGKQDKGDYSGRLETATGPLTIAEVRSHAKWPLAVLQESLGQLLAAKFVIREPDGTLTLARFKEKAAPLSHLSTERSRTHRERKRNDDATVSQRPCNGPEADSRSRYDSLRSSAIQFAVWPEDPRELSALALIFLDRFANLRDPDKFKRHLRPYASTLASMRQRGVTIAQAWKACEDCWKASGEVPLFGGQIKNSFGFLPARISHKRDELPVQRVAHDPVTPDLPAEERAANLKRLAEMRAQRGVA